MIKESFHLNDTKIAFDNGKGDISFISHAHSDHLNGVKSKEKIISSIETKELANLKGEIIEIKNTKMLEAGHILGSKQLLIETDEKTINYAGDIRVKDSILFKGAKIPKTDELIIEATYGDPKFKFPTEEEIYLSMEKWVKQNNDKILLIGGYEMGKAQEIIKILNEYCSVTPVVNEKIAKYSDIYNKYGKKLEYTKVGTDEAEEVMKDPFVGVVPTRQAKRYFAKRIEDAFNVKTLCAFASGWTLKYRFNVDKGFALSDHAPYEDLKYYIEESETNKVKFFCGTKEYLEKDFKHLL